jgi:predicted HicB family RNase H-like nuclease
MKNILYINGQKALIVFDPDIGLLRGEFLDLSGGADFYAREIKDLVIEGQKSLDVYLDLCAEKRIEPYREGSI